MLGYLGMQGVSAMKVFRTFRCLRPLRAMSRLEGLKVWWEVGGVGRVDTNTDNHTNLQIDTNQELRVFVLRVLIKN